MKKHCYEPVSEFDVFTPFFHEHHIITVPPAAVERPDSCLPPKSSVKYFL